MTAETAAQVFSRLGTKETLGDLSIAIFSQLPLGLVPGDVVEVGGGEGVGKTELLLNIVAQCVLPKAWKGVRLSGRSIEVVYICTDYKFSVLRLASLLEKKLLEREHQENASAEVTAEAVRASLGRTHVLYCNSTAELTAALHSLHSFLSAHPEASVLVLDHITAFYWVDKSESSSAAEFDLRQHQWVGALRDLVREHHLVVFAAKLHMWEGPRASTTEGTHKGRNEEPLGSQWQQLVRYQYALKRLAPQSGVGEPSLASHVVYQCQQVDPPGPAPLQFIVDKQGLQFLDV